MPSSCFENSTQFFQQKMKENRLKQIQKDLAYGLEMEEVVCPILEKYFADNLTKTSQYHTSDWVGEEGVFYELKSRQTITEDTYATTIFPCYKCKIGENNPLILVFHFSSNNHTYYIKYDKEIFSNYTTQFVEASRKSDIAIKHYEIPIADLIFICNNQNEIPFDRAELYAD